MKFGRKARVKNQRPTNEVCLKDGVQNAAQTLLANIRFSSVDTPMRVISVTSSIPNEGKTTVALALAIAIGRSGATCLIVEGDMRRRSMKSLLGARPTYGIHRLLTGKCTFQEAIVPTDFENVHFLDSEQGIPNPDGILSSRHFTKMLDTLRRHYHYIIVDTPPVSAFADAAIISNKADGTVLVAREGYTSKREISYAAEQLSNAGANVLGIVMNGRQGGSGSGYGGGYYYDYYYNYYSDDEDESGKGDSSKSKGSKLSSLRKKDPGRHSSNTPIAASSSDVLRDSADQTLDSLTTEDSNLDSSGEGSFGGSRVDSGDSKRSYGSSNGSRSSRQDSDSASGSAADEGRSRSYAAGTSVSSGYKVPIIQPAKSSQSGKDDAKDDDFEPTIKPLVLPDSFSSRKRRSGGLFHSRDDG